MGFNRPLGNDEAVTGAALFSSENSFTIDSDTLVVSTSSSPSLVVAQYTMFVFVSVSGSLTSLSATVIVNVVAFGELQC